MDGVSIILDVVGNFFVRIVSCFPGISSDNFSSYLLTTEQWLDYNVLYWQFVEQKLNRKRYDRITGQT